MQNWVWSSTPPSTFSCTASVDVVSVKNSSVLWDGNLLSAITAIFLPIEADPDRNRKLQQCEVPTVRYIYIPCSLTWKLWIVFKSSCFYSLWCDFFCTVRKKKKMSYMYKHSDYLFMNCYHVLILSRFFTGNMLSKYINTQNK